MVQTAQVLPIHKETIAIESITSYFSVYSAIQAYISVLWNEPGALNSTPSHPYNHTQDMFLFHSVLMLIPNGNQQLAGKSHEQSLFIIIFLKNEIMYIFTFGIIISFENASLQHWSI